MALGRQLRQDGYQFVTPTPASHARVLRREQTSSDPLRDVFGWNRSFKADVLLPTYGQFLKSPLLFKKEEGDVRSNVRFSTISDLLCAHSGFPTTDQDAVFFGPDTYRFCRAIAAARDRDPGFKPQRIFDIGAGSGAGGLFTARLYPSAQNIVLADVNARALRFATANSKLNGISQAAALQSDILASVPGEADLIVSNPPYVMDLAQRAYRDGGGRWGEQIAIRILEQALPRLAPGGRLLLYTGSPIVDGCDMFLKAAQAVLCERTRDYRYEEIDPDVFGEELETPPYDQADRIATMVLHVEYEDLLR